MRTEALESDRRESGVIIYNDTQMCDQSWRAGSPEQIQKNPSLGMIKTWINYTENMVINNLKSVL